MHIIFRIAPCISPRTISTWELKTGELILLSQFDTEWNMEKVRIILYKINKTENLVSSSFCVLEATLNINGEAAVSLFLDIHDVYVKVIVLDWHMYRTGYQNSEYLFWILMQFVTLSFKVLKAAYIHFKFHTDHQITTTFVKVAYI